jgi:hypothetical protein
LRTPERPIENGSAYNLEKLDQLYHRHSKIYVIDENLAVAAQA